MSEIKDFENMEAMEVTPDELEAAAGGKFKKPDPKTGFIIYQIKPGDTLYKIAKAYRWKTDDLLAWNPKITDRNLIRAGDYLYIKRK